MSMSEGSHGQGVSQPATRGPAVSGEDPHMAHLTTVMTELCDRARSWLAQPHVPDFIRVGNRVSFAALGSEVDRAIDALLVERARSRLAAAMLEAQGVARAARPIGRQAERDSMAEQLDRIDAIVTGALRGLDGGGV